MLRPGRLLITALVVLTPPTTAVEAGSCYSCTQVNNHDSCNQNTEPCTNSDDVCYTKVEKLDSIGKVYTKGCMTVRICSGLQELNREGFCARFPSTCFYCCDGSLCNQYNAAPTSGQWYGTGVLCALVHAALVFIPLR